MNQTKTNKTLAKAKGDL